MQRNQLVSADLETANALQHVRRPAGLAELPIINHVKPDLELLADDISYRISQERVVTGATATIEQCRGPRQAAGVRRQNPLLAASHATSRCC